MCKSTKSAYAGVCVCECEHLSIFKVIGKHIKLLLLQLNFSILKFMHFNVHFVAYFVRIFHASVLLV